MLTASSDYLQKTPFIPSPIASQRIQPFAELCQQSGLVVEGGGMRGVFTIGVLDCFLDAGIHFPYVCAVSAGACNALSFLSLQRGRARASTIDMLAKYQYIGLRHLRTKHSVIDFDTIFNTIPQHDLPFDYPTFFERNIPLEMVVTNCRTGRAEYLSGDGQLDRLLTIARASSSLPFVCPIINIDGQPYLDGGIVDSIPLKHALHRTKKHQVVICTREHGYRSDSRDRKIPHFIYSRYPRLRVVLSHRHKIYNEQLSYVEAQQAKGKIYVIRPKKGVTVGRFERNTSKLNALYVEGYRTAYQMMLQYADAAHSC